MANYKIKNLGAGSKFIYGGARWVLLQKTKQAALCIAEKILFNKAFDDGDSNNWAEASLRKYLNNDFLQTLCDSGADKEAFANIKVDLTADDGLKDYASVTDKISLITCDLYRKHRYLIPNADDWWWTATAYSTASNGYSSRARIVNADGTLYVSYACNGSGGVRPLCNIKSFILVEVTELKGFEPDEEEKPQKEESEPKQQAKPDQSEESTQQLHKKAIKQAYQGLINAQNNLLAEDTAKLKDIVDVLNTLARISGIELEEEAAEEIKELHTQAVKQTLLCVARAQESFLDGLLADYPKEATAALEAMQAFIK